VESGTRARHSTELVLIAAGLLVAVATFLPWVHLDRQAWAAPSGDLSGWRLFMDFGIVWQLAEEGPFDTGLAVATGGATLVLGTAIAADAAWHARSDWPSHRSGRSWALALLAVTDSIWLLGLAAERSVDTREGLYATIGALLIPLPALTVALFVSPIEPQSPSFSIFSLGVGILVVASLVLARGSGRDDFSVYLRYGTLVAVIGLLVTWRNRPRHLSRPRR
jgi:F0F1-type ATP synthase membrane subunit c/vacuolar-type H+-ATPase subunit K